MTTSDQERDEQKLKWHQSAILNRKLIEAEILYRAWSDEVFRTKLESNATQALEETGISFLEGKTIRMVPEDPDDLSIILPARPPQHGEMDESELESMAGGELIDTNRCQLYKDSRKDDKYSTGFAFTLGVLVGVSWGHA